MKRKIFSPRIRLFKEFRDNLSRGYGKFIITLILIEIILFFLELLNPILYKMIVDDVMVGGEMNLLWLICTAYFIIFFFRVIFDFLQVKSSNTLNNKLKLEIKNKIWSYFIKLGFQEYNQYSIGDIKMRIDDDTKIIKPTVDNQIIKYITSVIFCITYIVLLCIISIKMALIAVVAIPFTFLLGHIVGTSMGRLNENNREHRSNYNTWIMETVQKWREIKANNLEEMQNEKFEVYQKVNCIFGMKWMRLFALGNVMEKFKNEFVMKIFLYFIGGIFVINEDITIGELFLFMSYFTALFKKIEMVNQSNINLKNNMPIINRMMDILKLYNADGESHKGQEIRAGNISFDSVSFKYDDTSDMILDDFNLNIHHGEKIALDGESGAGKSTIIKLMTGIHSSTKGRITIDGIEINNNEKDLRKVYKNIGIVMQENTFFNLSIRDNLLLSKVDASREEIENAAKAAYIHEFIETLPDKYETIIGERGIKLSGGQKQRIALTRLFLREPKIIILDEATSALDKETERRVNSSLEKFSKDRTVIIITHNLTNMMKVDRIVKLN